MKEHIDKLLPHVKTIVKEKKWIVVAIIVLALLSAIFGSKEPPPVNLDPQNKVLPKSSNPMVNDAAAGDTTADTVRTLTQAVQQLRDQSENELNTLKDEIKKLREMPEADKKRVEELETRMKDMETKKETSPTQQSVTGGEDREYPVNGNQGGHASVTMSDEITVSDERWAGGQGIPSTSPAIPSSNDIQTASPNSEKKDVTPIPKYTLPVGATLSKAVTMSALIGRIPVKGTVVSPYTFKALVGHENLAANGITIPGLEGIVVVGKVTGDMQLSCNRAEVHAITFVFKDGRISTKKSNGSNEALGELSTRTGNPCIPGEFKTNAGQFLATIGILGASEGAATAYAESQVRETQFGAGAIGRSVIGSQAKYVLGNSGRQVASDVKQWWLDRQQNSFDAVYTPANKEVVVNIMQQIDIDYDPAGRKTSYSSTEGKDLYDIAANLD